MMVECIDKQNKARFLEPENTHVCIDKQNKARFLEPENTHV